MSQSLRETLENAPAYFAEISSGYKSWGKVDVLKVAARTHNGYLLLDTEKNESTSTIEEWAFGSDYISAIFKDRKKIKYILETRQTYASEIRETIPPILDDQAQLLGVNVKIASNDKKIVSSICGRFATIVADGRCICIGNTLEDAYIAAQLLEKTSKSWTEAKYLGGAKSINIIEAWAMQQFYLLKYSKEAEKNI